VSTPVAPLDLFACELSGTTLIEASAGTGKTWNICGLYLRLLLERSLPVQKILVVTFTKAATAELRDRIRGRIVETLAVLRGAKPGPDPFVPALLQSLQDKGLAAPQIEAQLDLARASFDEAAIFTIHAFCQRALADAPFAAQMPLALELLESDAELRQQAVNDFWRRRILGDDRAALMLGRDDTPDMFSRLLQRRLSKPLSLLRWPDDVDTPPALDLPALREAHADARAAWQAGRDRILATLQRGLDQLNGNSYKPQSVKEAAREWEQLLFPVDPTHVLGLKAQKAELLGTRKLEACTNRNRVTPRDPFFPLAQALLDARQAARDAAAAHRLALLKALLDDGARRVRELKRERRVVAFDDLLFNLHERLADGASPWLADTLRARFPAALIDEFQDTDPLQFAIFQRIYASEGAPLFFVGDPKQAIYSFRNADLHTYLQAREHADAERTLAHNQRSSAALIAALNALFGANRNAFVLPGLNYRAVQVGDRRRSVLVDTTESRAALNVWMLPTPDGSRGLRKDDALAAAAQACAAEVARLLRGAGRGEITLDDKPLAAGDIAVLVRTHRQGNLMRDALRVLRIGSAELSQASVFHTSDAEELERLLAAVLEPTRERLLRAALVTEVLGRDALALEALSADDPRTAELMLRFAGYRDEWRRAGISPMLRRLMRDEHVSERLLARPDGERRMTNLLHLAERLQDASSAHASPQALLRWLRSERQGEHGSEAAQLRLDSDRNLVQIVTIHKSKGLEFPIVFCPFLWDNAAPPERGDGVEYHDDDHRPVVDFRPGARQDTDIKLRMRTERSAEELRLIYVALTRAVHRCHVVAGCYGDKAQLTASSQAMLNWLVAGDGIAPPDWFKRKADIDGTAAAWACLADAAAGMLQVADLPRTPGVPIDAPRTAADDIRALDPPRAIRPGWRIGSFSGMLHAAVAREPQAREPDAMPEAAVDHDADADAPAVTQPVMTLPEMTQPVTPDDILAFPRGVDAGTCLHAMLERADFRDRETWPGAVRAALAMHPQSLPGPDGPGRLERMSLSMLDHVCRTPLPTGFALQDVDPGRRLNELEFHLPSRGLTAAALSRMLQQHGYAIPTLAFGRLDGYLNGFIDLVFEHDGRHYLADWKSNHLGTTPPSYGPAALDAAMALHGYHLQALLYAVALDRHLATRLPHYDRARHFGGALYLFVRGIRPDWTVGGHPAGVHVSRPGDAVLDALSKLLQSGSKVTA
jgi:exodeoxyribonuclease V beta subunit